MFDLPVGTKRERKHATRFREALLDQGFEMAQFSVYVRYIGAREKRHKYLEAIKEDAPPRGSINVLYFTDKQFEQIDHIYGSVEAMKRDKGPGQLELF